MLCGFWRQFLNGTEYGFQQACNILNSLLELDNIHKVQISVEGDSALKYHDDISLAEPFIRNLDLVEQKNK